VYTVISVHIIVMEECCECSTVVVEDLSGQCFKVFLLSAPRDELCCN